MKDGRTVLVIEDDPVLGPAMAQRLRLEGFVPRLASSGAIALKEIAARRPDLVVSDIRLPDMTGEEVFTRMVAAVGLVPTFFVTAFGDIAQAVRLVKAGARDYLTKPIDVDALIAALGMIGGGEAAVASAPEGSLGPSVAMQAVEALARKVARTDLPVLILGETGTGKEVVARFLHSASSPDLPFVAVNCAAIPADLVDSTLFGHERGAFTGAAQRAEGVVARAGQGVLFLDEIAELTPPLQAKLLRLVQERSYLPVGGQAERRFGGRLICATHADLPARIAAGAFREDLYFRINVVEIRVPPLRERPADIAWLARRFLDAAQAGPEGPRALSEEATEAMAAHAWPGNVRELRNRIERAAALAEGPMLTAEDVFPERSLTPSPLDEAMSPGVLDLAARSAIRARVQEALRQTNGNQTQAAKLLGVSRTTIWKYLRDGGVS